MQQSACLPRCGALLTYRGQMERAGRYYELPTHERDRIIVQLRQRGVTLKRIGQQVGMSESGVKRAIDRIRLYGPGGGSTRD